MSSGRFSSFHMKIKFVIQTRLRVIEHAYARIKYARIKYARTRTRSNFGWRFNLELLLRVP